MWRGIWDTCQAVLAVAEFGCHRAGAGHATKDRPRVGDLYREARTKDVLWAAPPNLSGHGRIAGALSPRSGRRLDLKAIITSLVSLEHRAIGQPSARFAPKSGDTNIHRWNTNACAPHVV